MSPSLKERSAIIDELVATLTLYLNEPDDDTFARLVCKVIRLYGEREDASHASAVIALAKKLASMAANHGGGVAIVRFAGLVSTAYVQAGGLDLVRSASSRRPS
jgi:hypothetical protein